MNGELCRSASPRWLVAASLGLAVLFGAEVCFGQDETEDPIIDPMSSCTTNLSFGSASVQLTGASYSRVEARRAFAPLMTALLTTVRPTEKASVGLDVRAIQPVVKYTITAKSRGRKREKAGKGKVR